MKTRTRSSSRAPATDVDAPRSHAQRAALSEVARRALQVAASDPGFGERLRRARLALDER